MADVVDKATRSRMMSGIRGKNTKPELLVRSYLHAQGYRFLIHDRRFPGKPDLVLPRWRTVVFVHGCFWHWHSCRYFKLPQTRTDFWRKKLTDNKNRDQSNRLKIEELGWRVLAVYECALRDAPEETLYGLASSISQSCR